MTNKVRIDLNTLEKAQAYMQGLKEIKIHIRFMAKEFPEALSQDSSVILHSQTQDEAEGFIYEIMIQGGVNQYTLAFLIRLLEADNTTYTITYEREPIDIRSHREYDFYYAIDSEIKCEECGSRFAYDHVQESDSGLDDICPVCGSELEIEFESVSEALGRKDKKK